MNVPSTAQMAKATAAQVAEAEQSPVPVFIRIARALVWILYALAVATALLILVDFFLKLGGANPDSGFVEWVGRSVDTAMEPFRGIFPQRDLGGDSVLDFSLLFAAVVYLIVALLIDLAVRWLTAKLHQQQRSVEALRVQADQLARQAAAEQHTAEVAARDAAAREFARQQAATEQYRIAQAAAQEALARQAALQPLAPPAEPEDLAALMSDIERTTPPIPPPATPPD